MSLPCINTALIRTANNLIIQQLQIQALIKILPEDKQFEWLNTLNDLAKQKDINPETGERLNTTGELN